MGGAVMSDREKEIGRNNITLQKLTAQEREILKFILNWISVNMEKSGEFHIAECRLLFSHEKEEDKGFYSLLKKVRKL
jgi:hypothetical protein